MLMTKSRGRRHIAIFHTKGNLVTGVIQKDKLNTIISTIERDTYKPLKVYAFANGSTVLEAVFGRSQEGVILEVHKVEEVQ